MTEKIEEFYHNNLNKFGTTAQGVGWKNDSAQRVRFEQLFKIIRHPEHALSLNDLGCGTGDFVSFLKKHNLEVDYCGYDVMPDMIKLSKIRFENFPNVSFSLINSAQEIREAEYTIASGIFNIRYDTDNSTWLTYILDTLSAMNLKSSLGFAFNVLTKYSDLEFMKKELYYADPEYLFEYCKKNFSRNVALLHDYDQYDFTILVRKKI
jgi:SAM-dependent methyltransferase